MEMETLEKIKQELRNTHRWQGDSCIYCGCLKIKIKNPNASWDWMQYVDPETGEISRKLQCKTNQLTLL